MPNQSYEDEAKQAELELERDMKIFSDLKSIRIASDGRAVKIVAMSADVEAHIKKFSLKKVGSFQRSDPRVVDEARRLAQKRDNTLMVIRTDSGFDLYNMMEESEIRATQKSGCFIATAAYGSPLALEVLVFSRFRDEVLLTSKLGSSLVQIYYFVSPPLASLISRVNLLKKATRHLILTPILRLLKSLNNADTSKG